MIWRLPSRNVTQASSSGPCSRPHHGGDASETLDYRVFRTAAKPQTSYSNALALGALELQKISAAAGSAGKTD